MLHIIIRCVILFYVWHWGRHYLKDHFHKHTKNALCYYLAMAVASLADRSRLWFRSNRSPLSLWGRAFGRCCFHSSWMNLLMNGLLGSGVAGQKVCALRTCCGRRILGPSTPFSLLPGHHGLNSFLPSAMLLRLWSQMTTDWNFWNHELK